MRVWNVRFKQDLHPLRQLSLPFLAIWRKGMSSPTAKSQKKLDTHAALAQSGIS